MGHSTHGHMLDVLYTRTYYEDMHFSSTFKTKGAGTDPTLFQWPTNGGQAWKFDTGDELTFGDELPHWWKTGTNGKLHIHWTPHNQGVAESGNTVQWRVDLSVVDAGSVMPAVTTYILTDTCSGVDDEHVIVGATVDVDLSSITGTSAWASGRVYHLAGGSWTGSGAAAPALTQVGIHLEKDRPGSREEYTK